MAGGYSRKTNRQEWSEENMKKAIDMVSNRECGYLKAAKLCNVPKSTLERRVKGKNKISKDSLKGLGSRLVTFNPTQETELVRFITNMETMMFGLTTDSVRRLAYQFAVQNNIPHHFSNVKKKAGWHWLQNFLKRNRLSLRIPEATSAARARSFNQINVSKFFDLLEPLQQKNNYSPSRIYNVDETGVTTVQGRPSKVIAFKGRKQVGSLTSAERGTLCTAVICMNAAGSYIPPMLIFPRVRMKAEFLNGAPPETICACHPTGWMQLDLFEKWFDHFLKFSGASADSPTLLILDGHKTHTQNLNVIEKARKYSVTILCLPPHCSHRMQPLDVSCMAPLSTFYSQEVECFLRNHPGRVVTVYQIAEIFGKAYLRASIPSNAINGFRKTGIYPVDRNVFTEEMFSAAQPTDIPEELNFNNNIREVLPETPPRSSKMSKEDTLHISEPSTSRCQQEASSEAMYFSPEMILPYPKATKKTLHTKKPRTGETVVLTSTPFKTELEKSLERKRLKEIEKHPNIKRKIGKGKGKKKAVVKIKEFEDSSASEEDSNPECFYCGNNFSESKKGEGWIQCISCKRWVHDACAGAEEDQENFLCDYCISP